MTDIAFLDGGLGQEIHKRSNNDAHPLWSVKVMFDQPNIVTKVHSDFIQSGARVICLNTYTATQSRMRLNGFGDRLEIAHKTAIKLAKQSIKESSVKDDSVQIAGCLPPLIASYVAEVSKDYNNSLDEYRQLVDFQKDGVDLFLIETMSNIDEALAALAAVNEVNKPAFVSFTISDDLSTKLRSGEDLRDAINILLNEKPNGIMLNCSSPEAITNAMSIMSELSIPFGALGNGFTSISALTPGSTVDILSARKDLSPKVYAEFVRQWVDAGATIIGGCCEIGPEHIEFLSQTLKEDGHRLTILPV
jgi:S-methylmethionine-dependent homocysteine/selenocysteine methylase